MSINRGATVAHHNEGLKSESVKLFINLYVRLQYLLVSVIIHAHSYHNNYSDNTWVLSQLLSQLLSRLPHDMVQRLEAVNLQCTSYQHKYRKLCVIIVWKVIKSSQTLA